MVGVFDDLGQDAVGRHAQNRMPRWSSHALVAASATVRC
jgi:hypothetical protein